VTDPDPVRQGWQSETVATSYDQRRFGSLSGRVSQRLDFRALRRGLRGLARDAAILDLPCGTGRALQFLSERGFTRLTGADASAAMLGVAAERVAAIELVECDATDTRFADSSFDAVYSMRFFGHVPGDQRVEILKEMRRVSRGRVVIEVPVTSRTALVAKSLLRRLTVRSRLPKQFDWHVMPIKKVRDQAVEAGLDVVAVRRKLPLLSDSRYVELRKPPRSSLG
jgi:ubiquinone/menaquinone biosynthesis C-methylase UbiE